MFLLSTCGFQPLNTILGPYCLQYRQQMQIQQMIIVMYEQLKRFKLVLSIPFSVLALKGPT